MVGGGPRDGRGRPLLRRRPRFRPSEYSPLSFVRTTDRRVRGMTELWNFAGDVFQGLERRETLRRRVRFGQACPQILPNGARE